MPALPVAHKGPRLVLQFAGLAAIGLTVAAVVIVSLVRQAYATQGEQRAIARARLATELVLDGRLRASDVSGRVAAVRRRQLDRLFTTRVLRDGILSATLYDRRSAPVYATQRGAAAPSDGRADVRAALGGKVVARVESTGGTPKRILYTYVPLAFDGAHEHGVVALAQDFGPIAAATRHSTLVVAGVLEGVLLVLLLLLVPPLARASRRIGDQVAELDWLATHDELTGLANRSGFNRALEDVAADSKVTATVLLVDLDRFHEFNDTLGPAWADAMLVQAATRLRTVSGPLLVARTGEDEFGVLFAHAADASDQVGAIRDAFAAPLTVGDQRVAIEVRIGSAEVPRHGTEPDLLLRRAGVALSIAKQAGVRAQAYDPGHDSSDVSRLALTAELRTALRDGRLVAYYQPQADLATGAIRGVEALIRWQHPHRGLLAASEFIEAAEQTGLIADIRRLVIDSAAAQWDVWRAEGTKIDIAVNLAAVDLLDPDLPREIEAALSRHAMPAEYLVLEITERTLLRTEQQGSAVLRELQRIGARLAIDDYGTGYSSLAALRNLHARQVKLDRTFIQGLPGDGANVAIVRSTIELAHTLGATVVAEGVETHEQWQHLAHAGCDVAQGFLIGAALAPDALLPFVQGRPTLRIVAA